MASASLHYCMSRPFLSISRFTCADTLLYRLYWCSFLLYATLQKLNTLLAMPPPYHRQLRQPYPSSVVLPVARRNVTIYTEADIYNPVQSSLVVGSLQSRCNTTEHYYNTLVSRRPLFRMRVNNYLNSPSARAQPPVPEGP